MNKRLICTHIDDEDVFWLIAEIASGKLLSEVLKELLNVKPQLKVAPYIYEILAQVFGINHSDAFCLSGWYFITGDELSDKQINDFIEPVIKEAKEKKLWYNLKEIP